MSLLNALLNFILNPLFDRYEYLFKSLILSFPEGNFSVNLNNVLCVTKLIIQIESILTNLEWLAGKSVTRLYICYCGVSKVT